jgi:hypothetical protein
MTDRALELACDYYNRCIELEEIIEHFCMDAEAQPVAQPAPQKHDVEIRQDGKDEPYVSFRSKAVCDLLEEHLPVKLYTHPAQPNRNCNSCGLPYCNCGMAQQPAEPVSQREKMLLEALKEMEKAIRWMDNPTANKAWDKARAAIAQAEKGATP